MKYTVGVNLLRVISSLPRNTRRLTVGNPEPGSVLVLSNRLHHKTFSAARCPCIRRRFRGLSFLLMRFLPRLPGSIYNISYVRRINQLPIHQLTQNTELLEVSRNVIRPGGRAHFKIPGSKPPPSFYILERHYVCVGLEIPEHGALA